MQHALLVGIGGFMGSILRFGVGSFFLAKFPSSSFPWATFTVNFLGCLMIGIIASILERSVSLNSELRLLLITGFLGGFTTFSAFGIETFALYSSGNYMYAVLNIIASVVFGLLAVWGGMVIGGNLNY